jgi:hypothetical protein
MRKRRVIAGITAITSREPPVTPPVANVCNSTYRIWPKVGDMVRVDWLNAWDPNREYRVVSLREENGYCYAALELSPNSLSDMPVTRLRPSREFLETYTPMVSDLVHLKDTYAMEPATYRKRPWRVMHVRWLDIYDAIVVRPWWGLSTMSERHREMSARIIPTDQLIFVGVDTSNTPLGPGLYSNS